MSISIYHGNIIYSKNKDEIVVFEDHYLIVKDGFVQDIQPQLPKQYDNVKVVDYGNGIIIPAFSDLHIHGSQYAQRGFGMDKLLFDWLNDYTFPQEARFADMNYAKKMYDQLVRDLIKHGTFHAAIFTTIHYQASDYLFRLMEEKGLYGYVGKVNMDMNSPEFLIEDTQTSLQETRRFVKEHLNGKTVKPILTPRFAPTCSEPLLKGLGEIAKEFHVGLQTHLVESKAEAAFAIETHPMYQTDSEIYQANGLLDYGPVIFAHVIFPNEKDKELIRQCQAQCVHCPDSTNNVIAGIMPVDTLQKEGINISIGSDIGGGQDVPIYRQIASAVRISKLKEFYEPENNKTILFKNAFYMATKEGGKVFDRVGSLEPGYRFNALVLDGLEDDGARITPLEKLERFCYRGDDRNIIARYLDDKLISIDE